MRKILAFTLSVLLTLCVLTFPAYAEEVTGAPVTEVVTEAETIVETLAETETSIPFDEWIYEVMQQATPEQVELIEEIVLGGLNALDKLEIDGFDRVRIWVEYNMATVMTVMLMAALVAFFVVTVLQKKGFAKKADILNANAIEMYEAGQAQAEEAHAACRAYADRADAAFREYTARADAICQECVEAAKAAAEEAKAAHGQVSEERALLIAELDKTAKVNAAMCETVNFLLQCSDLSQAKREEAEAIFNKGMEAMNHDHTDEA